MKRSLLLLILIVASFIILSSEKTVFARSESINDDNGRIVIKFKSLVPGYFRNRMLSAYELQLDEKLKLPNTYIIKVPGSKAEGFIDRLKGKFIVDYVEKDHQAESLYVPNDPLFEQQWSLDTIDAPEAWDVSGGSSDVDIAIVDSGVDASHPDLSGKVVVSVDCTLSGCPQTTYVNGNDHATHVAGIAASSINNSLGVAGVAGGADLMSVRVLDEDGAGYYSWIANGIVWATDNGAEVINLSLGGRFSSFTLRNAIEYAWDNGVIVVAAAGNDGRYTYTYPAYYSDVIAVAATDESDEKAYFSNYGSWVDIAAPGVDIVSTDGGDYIQRSGTSMAAPHVSGVAALIISNNPSWDNSEVREKLEESADEVSGTGFYFRNGRVNACKAVDCQFITPTTTDTPVPTNTPTFIPQPTSTPTRIPTEVPTETPTPTDTLEPTQTPTQYPTSTPTPTLLPTGTPTPLTSPTSTPFPTPTPTTPVLPWWCSYVPWHYTCQ
ncbi:peptidase S8 [Candidatus Woesebacteria bacterium]|nr:peptidase S8 [Candidatus Woesebacteria bacterium]